MIHDLISEFAGELSAIRHDLHMHPELHFEEFRTSKIVAGELGKLGFVVTTGIAGTGVVGRQQHQSWTLTALLMRRERRG